MQDIHTIGGGAGGGRFFGGGGGGDRRLRPHHHHGQHALKCPRCESINTKFCYYNNYNLSQPRHFCKGCRRYWTKGGVLRNVPVGGGCHKIKRSKPKSNNSNPSSDAVALSRERKSTVSQNSSSESSSLTANTTAANTTATATAVNTVTEVSGSNSTNSGPSLFNFQESSARFSFNIPQSSTLNLSFDPPLMENSSVDNNMFPEIGTFTSLMTSSTAQLPVGFDMDGDIPSFRLHEQNTEQVVENPSSNQQQWMETDNLIGNHDVMNLSGLQNRGSNGGIGEEDWQSGADQALFDLTGTVDQSYWCQTQWNDHEHEHDHDHHLSYLP